MASEALFKDVPPFPDDVPTALMSTISFEGLRKGNDQVEKDVLNACKEVGFFLLDLSGTVLRLLKSYASPDAVNLRTSLIHHTDFGTVTLLANIVGGLQILKPGGSPLDESAWSWARPQPGCLIVNMGDAMTQWTGGILRSSMHRVTHGPGSQRFVEKYSIAYLARPERNASMKRLLDAHEASENEEDDNLTAWEWELKKATSMARANYVPQMKGVQI